MADTVIAPGGDAALVRVHGKTKGIAISTDVTPRYVKADPFEGGKQAVAECWRNLTAVGAHPLAVTDNLNFGNPEKPEVMGDIVSAIDGLAEACRALDFPVVSGNCSLYNETNGEAILPTPAIGGVGLVKDVHRTATIGLKNDGDVVLLIGAPGAHLGQSIYIREIEGREEGAAPPVNLAAEKKHGDFVRGLIEAGRVTAVHDISDGGLAVALAEMAMAGGIGAELNTPEGAHAIPYLFGEDQARYVITATQQQVAGIMSEAMMAGIQVATLGTVTGTALAFRGTDAIPVADLKRAHEGWFPNYMASSR
jgi:phosphoribosylformylglycinamidine synthase